MNPLEKVVRRFAARLLKKVGNAMLEKAREKSTQLDDKAYLKLSEMLYMASSSMDAQRDKAENAFGSEARMIITDLERRFREEFERQTIFLGEKSEGAVIRGDFDAVYVNRNWLLNNHTDVIKEIRKTDNTLVGSVIFPILSRIIKAIMNPEKVEGVKIYNKVGDEMNVVSIPVAGKPAP